MATTVSYTVTPEPNFGGAPLASGFHQPSPLSQYQQQASSIYRQPQVTNPPSAVYQYPPVVTGPMPVFQPQVGGSAYQGGSVYQGGSAYTGNSLAVGPSHVRTNDMATTTSHIAGVVPTGLFTTYIPANKVDTVDHHHVAKAAKKPVTVYYTDDLYPPYYAKAKKVSSQKKKTGCCA